ncbi:MAG: 30S ribosomal protein S18 [Patescibacteria group bacterium]
MPPRRSKKDEKDKRRDSRREFVSRKPAVCPYCQSKTLPTYKNWEELAKSVSDRGKILPRLRTGICAKHQRNLARAVKRARHLALLPFSVRPV